MSYTALARKWRPRNFTELLGQDHIKKILVNSIEQKRIHHAYLFTGTRGVGKTSVARLFAKALNCEKGITANPCLECSNCIAIEQGHFIDLIEVDGASRTRVDDTRELMENIQYIPTIGRFKIYLIDEVHMLSNHSCNALLKTLEEPPEHVKFLLATTDPQKLPITVLSRCLQFNLKPITTHDIEAHLKTILNEEQLSYEQDSLSIIAKAARGSMRDALSLLDQAIAGSGTSGLSSQDIKQLLGYSQQDYALQLLLALAKLDPHKMLTISRQISSEGGQFQYVLDELLNYLHYVSISQTLSNNSAFITNICATEIQFLAQHFSPEDTQLFYQIALKSQEDLHLAPTPSIAFEMMLLRMVAFKPASQNIVPPLALAIDKPVETELNTFQASKTLAPEKPKEPTANAAPLTKTITTTSVVVDRSEITHGTWSAILPKLNLTGLALNAAENAEFIIKEALLVKLRVDKGHLSVFTPSVVKRIEEGLSQFYGESIKIFLASSEPLTATPAKKKRIEIEIETQAAEQAIQNDPFFKTLTQEFSAELVRNSISSVRNSLQLEAEQN